MGDIFNLDNKFFQTLGKGVDCVCLSLLWMICCIPLAFGIYVAYVSKAIILALPCIVLAVPAGIATTALYYAVNKVIRHSRGYLWSSFWHSFKTNMKQGAFVTLIVAAAVVLVGLDGYIMYQFAKAGEKSGVLYVVFFVLMLVVIAWAIYVFPYMARFENSTKLILKNSALMAIGNLDRLPADAYATLQDCIAQTSANTGVTLILALSYSARWEITEAVKRLAREAVEKKINPDDITEAVVSDYLTTKGIPDPDLLIRTGGEQRVSNFLLWQLSYAEFFFTDVYWPDFREEELYGAILYYQQRERRFGKTSEQLIL